MKYIDKTRLVEHIQRGCKKTSRVKMVGFTFSQFTGLKMVYRPSTLSNGDQTLNMSVKLQILLYNLVRS